MTFLNFLNCLRSTVSEDNTRLIFPNVSQIKNEIKLKPWNQCLCSMILFFILPAINTIREDVIFSDTIQFSNTKIGTYGKICKIREDVINFITSSLIPETNIRDGILVSAYTNKIVVLQNKIT